MIDKIDLLIDLLRANDNDPCPCLSGRKYKDCHKIIVSREKEHPAKIAIEILKTKSKKRCLYGKGFDCGGEIIKAHSISQKYLQYIKDETNHVYSFIPCLNLPTIKEIHVSDYYPNPQKIGINDVSTFYGLCAKHDRELFQSFELKKYSGSIEQIKAMHLRALIKEIDTKEGAILATEKTQKYLGKVDKTSDVVSKNLTNALFQLGNNLALRDLLSEFSLIRNSMLYDSDDFKYVSLKINGECPIACSSIPNPAFDLNGNIIQNYNDEKVFTRSFSINVLPESNNEYYLILSWIESKEINRFMESLVERGKHNLLQYLVQLVFVFSENMAISIKWFDSLSLIKRERLKKIFWLEIKNQDSGQYTHNEYRNHQFIIGQIESIMTNTKLFT